EARRGDHPVDDAGGARAARDHRRQPQAAHRAGERHHGGRHQPGAEPVQADAADDEAGKLGQDAAQPAGVVPLTAPSAVATDVAVAVEDLVKTYGGRRAVDGVSFAVARGETFALLGPNGAGKTTTLEILEGYRAADAGTVRVLGLDPRRDGAALRPRIGVMLQESGLYRAITPREALHLFASYYAAPAEPDRLLALVGLEDAARTRYRRLSGGQRQRLAL